MLHVCVQRFDVTKNLEKIYKILGHVLVKKRTTPNPRDVSDYGRRRCRRHHTREKVGARRPPKLQLLQPAGPDFFVDRFSSKLAGARRGHSIRFRR